MELSLEDSLRLNVLLAQQLHAVRIDESKMIVHALTVKGEAKIQLNSTGKDEAYVKKVKELFSAHVKGSPGGYPIYLEGWTRMGQARDENLAKLLLLGEPEAVVATAYASGLTDELAARVWWAMPTSEIARRMLEKPAVAEGNTGKVLAEFLIEFLPFEEDHSDMIESVRLVLQPGLISQKDKEKLWSKTKTKRSFYVGFLHSAADDLPIKIEAHPNYDITKQKLTKLEDNAYAQLLLKVLSTKGQAFLKTVEDALKKPGNQDVVVSLLAAVANYFENIKPIKFTEDNITVICSEADTFCYSSNTQINEIISALEDLDDLVKKQLCAMIVLSCLSVKLVDPIFSRTDAIGTLMRKKIKPVTEPVFRQLYILRN